MIFSLNLFPNVKRYILLQNILYLIENLTHEVANVLSRGVSLPGSKEVMIEVDHVILYFVLGLYYLNGAIGILYLQLTYIPLLASVGLCCRNSLLTQPRVGNDGGGLQAWCAADPASGRCC